jgi:hypothetical protein
MCIGYAARTLPAAMELRHSPQEFAVTDLAIV